MYMRRLLSFILILTIIQPLQAKYNPVVNIAEEQLADVKKGVVAVKRLPKLVREACIAEKLGLLFMPDGSAAYSNKESFHEKENVKYFKVLHGARFIGTDGKIYGFYDVLGTLNKNPKLQGSWVKAKQAIFNYGDDAIFSAFKEDVAKIILLTAKNRLMSMPEELRSSCLAQYSGWVYTQDGKNAVKTWHYVSRSAVNLCEGTHKQAVWNEILPNALFTTPDGAELSWDKIYKEQGKHRQAWGRVGLCVDLVGIKDIMAIFPKERDAMREAYERRTGTSAPPLQ